jgi:nitroreductase
MKIKILSIFICMLLITTAVSVVTGKMNIEDAEDTGPLRERIDLPDPMQVDMVLEKSICRRVSVRSFTGQAITDEELSTVLWAAYGFTDNGTRTIFNPNGRYSTVIYVIRSDATYKYIPENHSLSLFKTGNYLSIGLYDTAPIKFGLVWDTDVTEDEMEGVAQIGMVGQNIYFDANALDLATVTTGMSVSELTQLGIPANEEPEIIMPLGHPSTPYDFTYDPLPVSNLPRVVNNTLSLADAINHRQIVSLWDNQPLSPVEQSQLVWSSYGSSYYIDETNNKRHRTPPSAIGIYPYKIFAANASGVYQYNPSTHALSTILQEDRREEIQNALGATNITLTSAPWITIPCLDTNVGGSQYQTFWYYEVGAITHTILLEAAALDLRSNVISDIPDEAGLRTALGISSQTNLRPWAVVPTGRTIANNPPEIPILTGPTSGDINTSYSFTAQTTDPDGDNVYYWVDWGDGTNTGWVGPYPSGVEGLFNHIWNSGGSYLVKAKAKDVYGAESDYSIPLQIDIAGPHLEITIRQRGIGAAATITNDGTEAIANVTWKITLDGGIVLFGKTKQDTISQIMPGGAVTVSSFTFGFFRSTINATAGDSSDSLEVFLLGPLVL